MIERKQMSENWYAIGHAVQGRGHELETPPIPCQDKFYPPEPTTYNMPGEIAVIALADGADLARFSHLGAQKTIEVVARDLRENFTHYFNMARSEETSSAILERVIQALQELSVETANTLQHNKSDVESILQAILEEVRAVQDWQETWHLPLLDTTQTLQKRLQTDQEQRHNAQEPILNALTGIKTEIGALQEAFQGKDYQLEFSALENTLKDLKSKVAEMHCTLQSPQESPILESKYQAIVLGIGIEVTKIKNGGWFKRLWRWLFGSKAQKQAQHKLQALKDALASSASLQFKPWTHTLPKNLKDFHLEDVRTEMKAHQDILEWNVSQCFKDFRLLLKEIGDVSFENWDEKHLKSLFQVMATTRTKHQENREQLKAQIKQANTHLHIYQQQLLDEIRIKEQECVSLMTRFVEIKHGTLHLEENLQCALNKLAEKVQTLNAPYTLQNLRDVLLALQKENLQQYSKLYEDYATQSAQVKNAFENLKASLPHANASQQPCSQDILNAPKHTALLDYINTLETQTRDFQSMQERLEQCQTIHQEAVALEKVLRQDLAALVMGYATLQPSIYTLQAQSLYHIQDLDSLDVAFVQSCLQRLEQHLRTEQELLERLQRELQESSSPAPHFNFTLPTLLQRLQQAIQNKACDLHDFASTLLVTAIDGDQFLLLHLGDGVCGVLKDRQLVVANYPENGKFDNEAIFTTSKNAPLSAKVFKGKLSDKNFTGFVLMSKGASEFFYHDKEDALVTALQDYMNVARAPGMYHGVQDSLKALLETRVREKTFDDCSVVMLVKQSMEPLSESEQRLKTQMETISNDG